MGKFVKNGLAIGIFFVLLMAMVVITVPENVSAAITIHVSTDGDDYTGTGTQQNPYQTIQKGINMATSGDTVYVHDGTYTLSTIIKFTTSGITLEGESQDGTIIDGNSIGNVIRIEENADDTTIEEFTIKNSGNDCAGIYLKGAGSPKNYVTGCEISDIEFENNEYGIHLKYAGKDANNYNTFENLDFNNHADDAIYVEYSNYNTFTTINIVQDEDETDDGAVHLRDQSSNNVFNYVTIEKNYDGVNYYDGFGIRGTCNNNEIRNSDIQQTRNGIHLSGNQKMIICDNEIYDNNNNGIDLIGSDDNHISNNEIYDNNDLGINLAGTGGSDNNEIINNKIYDNIENGIKLVSSNQNDIYSNLILNNGEAGVYLSNSANNYIGKEVQSVQYGNEIGNPTSGTQEYGIYLVNSDDNYILYNDVDLVNPPNGDCGIHHNQIDGIYLETSDDITIAENIILGNDRHGINMYDCDYNTIGENTISNNDDYGIYFEKSGTDEFIYNLIYQNEIEDNYIGIYLYDDSKYNWIQENTIEDNTNYGVKIVSSNCDDNLIFHNNFLGNHGSNQYYNEATLQAYNIEGAINNWDNGYGNPFNIQTDGGNYWSDWVFTTDLYKGPNQDIPGADGIKDGGYHFGSLYYMTDWYPLASVW